MKGNIIRFLLFIIITLWVHLVNAQFDIGAFKKIQEEYPNTNIIKLEKKVDVIIKVHKGKLDINLINKEKLLYLKNTKGVNPERSTYSSKFKELVDFEACSHVLDKNKYIKVPVKDYKKVSNFDNDVFYDDYEELVFTFPGIAEGSIIELKTIHKLHEPRFLNSIFLNDFYPIHKLEINFECDPDVYIDFLKQNILNEHLKIDKSFKKKKNFFSIVLHKRENILYERLQPDRRYFTPHIIPIIRSYKVNGQEYKLLENVAEMNSWYYSFIENLYDEVEYTGFKEIIKKELSDDMTELEKVKSLYYWVQQNIKYIAFEHGIEGFIPRKPDEVLKRRYGDCKDKSSLLHALLKESGIKSHFTWIGSRDIPYKFSEIPSPIVDNHMIITYIDNEDYYYLDATGNYQLIEIPTSFIQGKEALINMGKDKYEIKEVPIIEPQKNEIIDSVWMSLDGRKIYGKGNITTTGLTKVNLLNIIITDDEKSQKEDLENFLQKGNNKFVLTDYFLPEGKMFSDEYSLSYSFDLEDYASNIGDEIYLNLNLNRNLLKYKLEEKRKNPLELRNTLVSKSNYVFKIPDSWNVTYLPKSSFFENNGCKYLVEYDYRNGNIYYDQEIVVDKIFIQEDEFREWNNFISTMEKDFKKTILLEKKD